MVEMQRETMSMMVEMQRDTMRMTEKLSDWALHDNCQLLQLQYLVEQQSREMEEIRAHQQEELTEQQQKIVRQMHLITAMAEQVNQLMHLTDGRFEEIRGLLHSLQQQQLITRGAAEEHESEEHQINLSPAGQRPVFPTVPSTFTLSLQLFWDMIGSGMMSMPSVFRMLGLFPAIMFIIVIGALACASVDILLRHCRAAHVDKYEDLVHRSFGGFARKMFQFFIVLNNFAAIILFLNTIGDILCGSRPHSLGILEVWFRYNNRLMILFVTGVVIVVLRLSLHRRKLGCCIIAVILAALYVVLLAWSVSVTLVVSHLPSPRLLPDIANTASAWDFVTSIPTIAASFVNHYNVHTIDQELGSSSSIRSFSCSCVLSILLYLFGGITGVLLFGDSTSDNVLLNFGAIINRQNNIRIISIGMSVMLVYALHLLLVLPFMLGSLRSDFERLIPSRIIPENFQTIWLGAVPLALHGLALLLTQYPHFMNFLCQLNGALVAGSLGFILPAVIALRDPGGIAIFTEKILSSVFGFAMGILFIIATYRYFVNYFSHR
ncbi:hypothetical protein PIB30_084587 [Stylosanthes scabra]|uniref:Amino acid transporter transmembrane domain-containing protein n=1 Tax=Stylosanthes scabra TaxID=79078 RepID=A0ABU6VTM8_9FABA|nr:hypothetical protein [Stylosanthes scabra]